MKALYTMRYVGHQGVGLQAGAGAIYIGDGMVLGVDIRDGRYKGRYAEADGILKGEITLTAPPTAPLPLVTGIELPPGQSLQFTLDWPVETLEDGKPKPVWVAGRQVSVVLDKVGDIPG